MTSTSAPRRPSGRSRKPAGPKPEPVILFQQYFKSVGPRTYAAQVKRAANGNHFLVLTEGKRDEKTNELRKSRVFIYGEDFVAFFKLVQASALFVKANPVPEAVVAKRAKVWAKGRTAGPRGGAPELAAERAPAGPDADRP